MASGTPAPNPMPEETENKRSYDSNNLNALSFTRISLVAPDKATGQQKELMVWIKINDEMKLVWATPECSSLRIE